MTNQEMVAEFHRVMDQPAGEYLSRAQEGLVALRATLIQEEWNELCDELDGLYDTMVVQGVEPTGMQAHNLLKEMADLMYVLYGFAVSFGLPLDEAFKRVHESNMSKLVDGKPLRREDGKVLKGPNYKAPDLTDLLT
jgi:predicted HAD superfamily Cof-like phosphohydrolase